ncbi:putative RNA-directed DNA polymerase, eukaryota, reverse transcriptase zinc-binding domain protein [Tanacetum coccineum]
MGDSEWQEVTRKKRRSVFERLDVLCNLKYNMEDLVKISSTVYVSNFPSHLTVRELWQICRKKGTLVDIGKLRLHANMARFDRKACVKSFHAGVKIAKSAHSNTDVKNSKSYANAAKTITKSPVVGGVKAHADGVKISDSIDSVDTSPSINLNQDNSNNFPLAVLGRYKEFRSIVNSRIVCRNEGFPDVGIKYLGGLWVLFDFHSMDARIKFLKHEGVLSWFSSLKPWHDDFVVKERLIWIEVEGVPLRAWHNDTFKFFCNKWGEMLFCDESDGCKRLCIKSSYGMLVFATILVTVKGVSYAIREEVPNDNDAESIVGDDLEQTINQFNDAHSPENVVQKQDIGNDDIQDYGDTDDKPKDTPKDSDPFGLEPLIMKNCGMASKPTCSTTPVFPPCFSPKSNGDIQGDYCNACNQNHVEVSESTLNHSKENSKKHFGFSMVERLEETIKVGVALGFNMEGYENTLASLIAANRDTTVWVNFHFDFASATAREKSGEGLWTPKDVRIMWIVVYGPQNLSSKIALWFLLATIIANWKGILVTMGDFNEVRTAGERYGSIFNERNSEIFNSFISNSSLFDIPLGGFNFTWTDKWGSKMSKLDRFLVSDSFLNIFPYATGVILDKGRPDHRSILLNESVNNDDIDVKIDNSCASDEDFLNRRDSIKIPGDIDRREACDFAQKSKIKFLPTYGHSTSLNIEMPNCLSPAQCQSLEHQCSREEIKKAVWDCGSDRTPGPNGFTFNFITSFWDLLEADVVRFMHDFFHSGTFPKGCNSSFISLIPKVPNAKFISDFRPISLIGCQYKIIGKILANGLSTVIRSCVSSEQTTFIKVDFEKAFDSVRWDFLDLVMEKLGFGLKWRFWIHGCLKNARSSVLVNGSPTSEFELFKGLRQGDPLSPLLFILVMEGLHVITCKSVDLGLFRGVLNGRYNLSISHLMYVDDVIFLGEWSQSNIQNLLCMLRCFFLVSGLKINVQKSNISGVSVPDEDAADMAKIVGCGVANFPLKYLGVPVGCNMSRCAHWNPIIQRFSSKLAQWKARLLSVGGRLSLIKSVHGNLPAYCMSIYLMHVSIQKKLESMRNNFFIGGLLFKWIWRFRCHSNDLWARVIKNVYGHNGGIHDDRVHSYSTWGAILSSVKRLKQNGTYLLALCVRKIGNGVRTSFWNENWCGNSPLKTLYPRIYMLDSDRDRKVANWFNVRDWSSALRRLPRGGVETSQFNALLSSIKDVVLSDQNDSWILALNKVPTRVNLDGKGIGIDSTLCPICGEDVETVNHIFCWELYFELIMTKHIKDGGPTRQSWNNINAD